MKKSSVSPSVGMALAMILLMSNITPPSFADSRIRTDIKATPLQELNDEELQSISISAGRIIMHVENARGAVARSQRDAALREIEQALTLAQMIKKAMPEYKVSATIQGGDLIYTEESIVKPLIVPVYRELNLIPLEKPLLAAKRQKAKRSTTSQSFRDTDLSVTFTQVKLDVGFAMDQLDAAKQAVEEGKLEQVDQHLAEIQANGVIFEFSEANIPLIKARRHLMTAKKFIEDGNVKKAKRALQAASDALEIYANTAGDYGSDEALALTSEINALIRSIGKDREGAVKKIRQIWNKIKAHYSPYGFADYEYP